MRKLSELDQAMEHLESRLQVCEAGALVMMIIMARVIMMLVMVIMVIMMQVVVIMVIYDASYGDNGDHPKSKWRMIIVILTSKCKGNNNNAQVTIIQPAREARKGCYCQSVPPQ